MNISGRPIGHFIDSYDTYSDIPRWLSISIYVWFSAKQLGIKNTTETKEQTRHTTWLHHFIRVFQVFQVIWLLYLIPYAIPATTNWVLDTLNWYPVYLPLAVLIYYLGLKGYLVTAQTIKTRNSILKENLDQSQINDLMGRLYKSMEEEKLYRDPNLNLVSLSQHVGFSSKTISALLNQEVQKNFNEFINSYRIGEIKERLLEKENQNITIVGLAYECGFNSQPTFQRAFKTIVGVSPKKFLAQTT
jgi:AraC-like DNA-binding protein